MNLKAIRRPLLTLAALSSMTLFLVACASTAPVCGSPQSRNLNTAIDGVQTSLINGCHAHFDRYYDELLDIAEGDPKPENKREFSEFLVWS
jgi:hypothetical protein